MIVRPEYRVVKDPVYKKEMDRENYYVTNYTIMEYIRRLCDIKKMQIPNYDRHILIKFYRELFARIHDAVIRRLITWQLPYDLGTIYVRESYNKRKYVIDYDSLKRGKYETKVALGSRRRLIYLHHRPTDTYLGRFYRLSFGRYEIGKFKDMGLYTNKDGLVRYLKLLSDNWEIGDYKPLKD